MEAGFSVLLISNKPAKLEQGVARRLSTRARRIKPKEGNFATFVQNI